jgi:Cu2+-exporting ATPase
MARAGLLVTRSHAVETLARATPFRFRQDRHADDRQDAAARNPAARQARPRSCLALAAAIEQSSEHPIAAALRAAAAAHPLPVVDDVHNEPGSGISACHDGCRLRLGRPGHVLALHGEALPAGAQALSEGGDTVIALGDETGWLALFRLGDDPAGSCGADRALRAAGRQVAADRRRCAGGSSSGPGPGDR